MFSRAAALVGIVPTAALAAPAPVMQPPAETQRVFQLAEIQGAGTQISTTMANEFMKEFKKIAVGDPGIDGVRPVFSEPKDLTDRACFDWLGYLSQHPDCEEIVGQGITKFELRFREALDFDTCQRRLDFVVHRVDTMYPHVRLHPHAERRIIDGGLMPQEELPVFGNLDATSAWRTTSTVIPSSKFVDIRLRDHQEAAAEHDRRQALRADKHAQACKFLGELKKNTSDSDWVVNLTKGHKLQWCAYIKYIPLQVSASGFSLQVCRLTGFQGHGGRHVELLPSLRVSCWGPVLRGEFQIVVRSSVVIVASITVA